MSAEVRGQSAIAATILRGEAQDLYIRRFLAIIRAARLNNHYPDGRRLAGHVRAMSPEVHGGIYDGLQINLDSGLPTYREFTRVQTDVTIAAEQMKALGARAALLKKVQERGHDIYAKQLAKYDYYDSIADLRLMPLGAMDVALRRIEPGQRVAHFYITFDKLEASGVFIRFRIALSQRNAVWNQEVVQLDAEQASHTEEFQSLVYRFSAMDAEFVFAKLAVLPGVEVESVTRTTVGPFYFSDLQRERASGGYGAPFDDLLREEGSFVAHFAIDQAGREVREDRDNDPFRELFESDLIRSMGAHYEQARGALGYKVFRDRKFVVSRGLEGALRALCAKRQTRNIVYGTRASSPAERK